jgi:transposase InsO family protein
VNVDICYLPVAHDEGPTKLPAVSGSSGHLVVERVAAAAAEATWPGQVFAAAHLDYASAMAVYVEQTTDRFNGLSTPHAPQAEESTPWRQEQAIRMARYTARQQRAAEDQAWRTAKSAWRQTRENRPSLDAAAYAAAATTWQQCRQARRARVAQRKSEDQAWHTHIAQLRGTPAADESGPQQWVAVAVLVDNCTRQCLGLPLFTAGAHLTSKELVSALADYLPTELEFVISDQGTHFRASAFADFAQARAFTHVLVYRHRPESNGSAERLVRTLKTALRASAWENPRALEPLLAAFQQEYNERPHQGLPIPGLSPNEYAKRIYVI